MLFNLEYNSGRKHGNEMYILHNVYVPAGDPNRFAVLKASLLEKQRKSY